MIDYFSLMYVTLSIPLFISLNNIVEMALLGVENSPKLRFPAYTLSLIIYSIYLILFLLSLFFSVVYLFTSYEIGKWNMVVSQKNILFVLVPSVFALINIYFRKRHLLFYFPNQKSLAFSIAVIHNFFVYSLFFFLFSYFSSGPLLVFSNLFFRFYGWLTSQVFNNPSNMWEEFIAYSYGTLILFMFIHLIDIRIMRKYDSLVSLYSKDSSRGEHHSNKVNNNEGNV